MSDKISTWTAVLTLSRLCLGPGLLVLPFATLKGGLIFSPIGIIVVSAWNGLSCLMMIECRNVSNKSSIKIPDGVLSSFSKVAYVGLGWIGVFLADFSVIVTLLGVCVAYQINFATLLIDLSGMKYFFSLSSLIVSSSFLVYPISCAKDLNALSSMSTIGLGFILLNIAAVIVYGIVLYYSNSSTSASFTISNISEQPALHYFPDSISDMASYFGIVVFCYGICAFVFPIEENMEKKSQFGLAVIGCLVFVCSLYILVGNGCAILYHSQPEGISGNILLNLPAKSIAAKVARISMSGVCILTYPLTLLPPSNMIEKTIMIYFPRLLQRHDSIPIRPTVSLVNTISESNFFASTMVKVTETEDTEISPLLRNIIRLILVVGTTLSAAYVPCFGLVVSLLGCFTITLQSFVIPSLLHLSLIAIPSFRRLKTSTKPSTLPESYRIVGNYSALSMKNIQKNMSSSNDNMLAFSTKSYHHQFNHVSSNSDENDDNHLFIIDNNDNSMNAVKNVTQNSMNNSIHSNMSSNQYTELDPLRDRSFQTELNSSSFHDAKYHSFRKSGLDIENTMFFWASSHLLLFIDIVLVIAGILVCASGTVITFYKLSHKFDSC